MLRPEGAPPDPEEPTHSSRAGRGRAGKKRPNHHSAFILSPSKQEEVGGKETRELSGVFIGKKRILKRQPPIFSGDRVTDSGSLCRL